MTASGPSTARVPVGKILQLLVGLGLLVFVASRADIGRIASGDIVLSLLILGIMLVPVALLPRAYSMFLIVNRHQRILSIRDAYTLTLVGAGLALVIPAGAADLVKAHWGLRTHGHAEAMVVATVLDKLTSLTALALTGAVGSLLVSMPIITVAAVALAVLSTIPFLVRNTTGWRLLLRVLAPRTEIDDEQIKQAASVTQATYAKLIAISTIGWVITYAITWLSCLAVGAHVDIPWVLAFTPISTLARMLPVSAAGIGVGEVTLSALLASAGVPAPEAARAVLLALVLLTLLPGAWGVATLATARSPRA